MSARPRKTPAKPPPNLSALAREHGVSRETLRSWRDTGTDLSNSKAIAAKVASMRDAPSSSLSAAKLEKIQVETARIKFALAVEAGNFIDSKVIENDGRQIGQLVRSTLDKAVADLPPMVAGRSAAEIQPILKRYIRALQTDLSKFQSEVKL